MSLTLYKPNKANKGSLFSIRFAAKLNKQGEDFKEGGFFVNLIKQVGWDDQKHVGRFSGGENISIKLGPEEAAKIIHVIERNANLGDISQFKREDLSKQFGFSNMHKSRDKTTFINFSPWQRQGDTEQTGFVFFVTQTAGDQKTQVGATFPFGDDIRLREYLKLGLEHIYMALYQEDKRRFSEKQNGNGNNEEAEANEERTEAPKATRKPTRPARKVVRQAEPEETGDTNNEGTVAEEEEPLF